MTESYTVQYYCEANKVWIDADYERAWRNEWATLAAAQDYLKNSGIKAFYRAQFRIICEVTTTIVVE
jgi:hypothetical protein